MQFRKGSATSIVLIAFAILIYILIPFGKAVFEQVFYQHICERMIVTLDSAVFASLANVDTEKFSEKKLFLLKEKISEHILRKDASIETEEIILHLDENLLTVTLFFKVRTIFEEEYAMKVSGRYLFEVLYRPEY